MKKSTLTIIGIIALVLIVTLIMYMKPDATVVDAATPQATTDNIAIAASGDNQEVLADEPIAQTSAPVVNDGEVAEGEIDFNAEVYGSSLPEVEKTVNEEGVVVPSPDSFLSDTASDPSIEPIDPVDDPANQIYVPPTEEDAQ